VRHLRMVFLTLFLVLYGALAYPWPGWRESYSTANRWLGHTLCGDMMGNGTVRTRTVGADARIHGCRTGVPRATPP
jgi:hypothetical protein